MLEFYPGVLDGYAVIEETRVLGVYERLGNLWLRGSRDIPF